MSWARAILGTAVGATVAAVALRVHTLAEERGGSFVDALPALPDALRDDASRVVDAAGAAIADGRLAAAAREGEIEAELVRVRQGREMA